MVAGDFTGNGILDIATPAGLYLGLGDGAFQYPPISLGLPDLVSSSLSSNNYTDIIAGDFTGNGKLDLALTDVGDRCRRDPPGQRRWHVPTSDVVRGGTGSAIAGGG